MKTEKMTHVKSSVIVSAVLLLLAAIGFAVMLRPSRLSADQDDYRRNAEMATRWDVNEQGWMGVWVRRGSSNVFDAGWTMPGQNDIQGVVEMHFSGRDVRMNRTDLYTNQHCEYRGQVSRDGRSAQGWVSCGGNPRVNWTATLSGGGYSGDLSDRIPPAGRYERREGTIVPRYNQSYIPVRFDMTGVWSCNDGGTYYLRQLGADVWWFGEAPNRQWSNIFHGALDGDWLEGFWLDVPKGRDRSHGALRLRLDSPNEFHREQKTGDDFGGSRWRRIR